MKKFLIIAIAALVLGFCLGEVINYKLTLNQEESAKKMFNSWVAAKSLAFRKANEPVLSSVSIDVQKFVNDLPDKPVELIFLMPGGKEVYLNLRRFLETQDIGLSVYEKPSILFIGAPGEYVGGLAGKDGVNPTQELHVEGTK